MPVTQAIVPVPPGSAHVNDVPGRERLGPGRRPYDEPAGAVDVDGVALEHPVARQRHPHGPADRRTDCAIGVVEAGRPDVAVVLLESAVAAAEITSMTTATPRLIASPPRQRRAKAPGRGVHRCGATN